MVQNAGAAENAGRIDEYVKPAELPVRLLDNPEHLRATRYISRAQQSRLREI
jgi:hypothetical protein